MGDVPDKGWLTSQLVTALGWDAFTVEGVVEAIDSAADQAEVDSIVQDYLGGQADARRAVQRFLTARSAAAAPPQSAGPARPPSRGAQASDQSASTSYAGATDTAASGGERRGPERRAGALTIRSVKKPVRQARGGAGGAGGGANADLPGSDWEKPVVNCLSCGKIYDSRELTEDLLNFARSGGVCTFCGARVALTPQERSQAAVGAAQPPAPATGRTGAGSAPASAATPPAPPSDATAAAVAFKDRLVGYDRNSAQRTAVIDDQSDYFEIDSNSWLSEAERGALRARQAAEEAAAARGRRRVTLTLDLMGRQVLVAEEEEAAEGQQGVAEAAAAAAAATEREAAQGGGASVQAALQGAGLGPLPAALRVLPNPGLPGPPPVFVRRSPTEPTKSRAGQGGRGKGGSAAAAPAAGETREQERLRQAAQAARQGWAQRVQHAEVFVDAEQDRLVEASLLGQDLLTVLG